MAVKFSAFTTRTGTLDAATRIVGYDDPAGTKTNVEFTLATLGANSGIYAADGTIGTTRKALITDTVQFRDSGDTADIFSLNTNGTFTLGKSAANAGGYSNVSIGDSASTASLFGVAVGRLATIGAAYSYATAVGNQATAGGAFSIQVGGGSTAGAGSIAIGYSSGSAATYAHNYGYQAEGAGNNSITFNASGTSAAAPSTQYAFGVYMTSNTSADFEVVGSGTSTLRTNLNVTGNMEVDGQAWGDLYDGGTIADGATYTPDWNNGNVQKIVIATGAAITVANGSNVNNGATYLLIIEQAGTGGTVTWGGKYKFPAATAPTLTSGAGKADVITMVAYNSASVLCSSTLDFLTT